MGDTMFIGKEKRKMDKRVMKTRRAIHEAMTKLLTVKPIEEITVTELAEKAEINRKTFYNYYNSVYMVAEEMEDEIVARFDNLYHAGKTDHIRSGFLRKHTHQHQPGILSAEDHHISETEDHDALLLGIGYGQRAHGICTGIHSSRACISI